MTAACPHCGKQARADPVDVVRDALRRHHGLHIWSLVGGIDQIARLAVNALRMAGILTDRPPDPGKETS